MSKAFVKETDGDSVEDLPDRQISPHPNYVTPKGLEHIEAELARLHQAHAAAQAADDRATLSQTSRELRYWTSRRATAQVVTHERGEEVRFGSTVTIKRDKGRRQSWRIVGEDEADPSNGRLSYVSPVAQALIGKKVGDVVQAGTSDAEIVAVK